jgi:hypothetical protein
MHHLSMKCIFKFYEKRWPQISISFLLSIKIPIFCFNHTIFCIILFLFNDAFQLVYMTVLQKTLKAQIAAKEDVKTKLIYCHLFGNL